MDPAVVRTDVDGTRRAAAERRLPEGASAVRLPANRGQSGEAGGNASTGNHRVAAVFAARAAAEGQGHGEGNYACK
ncbi:MAG: hypothetical protein DPW14_14950 [Planctomycetes bacterium]|nr:hypothetical protein [Planctomycetota bacterium]